MKKILFLLFALLTIATAVCAEDGSRLWLRFPTLNTARVKGTRCEAANLLHESYGGRRVTLYIDKRMVDDGRYSIGGTYDDRRLTSASTIGLFYGACALLRGDTLSSAPAFKLRILNHWDNPDGTIERGYAGRSILWNSDLTFDAERLKQYAIANASIGINGTVLNNVNASPKMLTPVYIRKVKEMADVLRPYGIRVYLSVNFGSPKALGELATADPLDESVRQWWKKKADEIYALVPDFGGFLVKANSEGQPGPFDYGRTHADGANMLADALKPHGGIVMWRSFVYGAKHKGEDRVKQAVSEFAELDGQFRDNVILQSKNGPLDFQPREPYAPIFDNITKTQQMAELQVTQEYLGHSVHLVYLAPMWSEFFSFVNPSRLVGIAGVANVGDNTNWCGHHFAAANWYAFGRLAWNPSLSPKSIAREWLQQTFGQPSAVNALPAEAEAQMLDVMMRSREACVDYMMPLGLHHIFKFDHHYGPEPDGFKPEYPIEWCPVYYHQADTAGVGFDRTASHGSGATQQYREPYRTMYENLETCPENLLLWFHHVPWTYKMKSGKTLWQELQQHYAHGVSETADFCRVWQLMKPVIDEQRWLEVDAKLKEQNTNAQEWQKVCTEYFGKFVR